MFSTYYKKMLHMSIAESVFQKLKWKQVTHALFPSTQKGISKNERFSFQEFVFNSLGKTSSFGIKAFLTFQYCKIFEGNLKIFISCKLNFLWLKVPLTTQKTFTFSRSTTEAIEKVWNMLKVNNKDTRATSLTLFWCLYC